jgi:hypothetical protein
MKNMEETQVELRNDMKNKEETQVEDWKVWKIQKKLWKDMKNMEEK